MRIAMDPNLYDDLNFKPTAIEDVFTSQLEALNIQSTSSEPEHWLPPPMLEHSLFEDSDLEES